jgi:hypothetical protein
VLGLLDCRVASASRNDEGLLRDDTARLSAACPITAVPLGRATWHVHRRFDEAAPAEIHEPDESSPATATSAYTQSRTRRAWNGSRVARSHTAVVGLPQAAS